MMTRATRALLALAATPAEADDSFFASALCAQTDPETFFPEKGGTTRDAKRICAACDVRDACLAFALAGDERYGVWGGLSERERRILKRSDPARSPINAGSPLPAKARPGPAFFRRVVTCRVERAGNATPAAAAALGRGP
jgi:WhiB family redox-sensing transcriptional regulator